MCDPVSIAGAALSAGGMMLNNREQAANIKRQTAARNAASEAELTRQRGYQQQGNEVFQGTLPKFTLPAQEAARVQAEQKRSGVMQGAVTDQGEYAAAPASAETANKEIDRKVAQGTQSARTEAASKARLGAWQDLNFGNRVGLASSARKMDTTADFARGSARLLPFEIESAQRNATKSPSGFGDLLQLGGLGLGVAGGMGWNPFGGGAPAGMWNGGVAFDPVSGRRLGGV